MAVNKMFSLAGSMNGGWRDRCWPWCTHLAGDIGKYRWEQRHR